MQRAPLFGAAQTYHPSIVRLIGAAYLLIGDYLQRSGMGATYLVIKLAEWEDGIGVEHNACRSPLRLLLVLLLLLLLVPLLMILLLPLMLLLAPLLCLPLA